MHVSVHRPTVGVLLASLLCAFLVVAPAQPAEAARGRTTAEARAEARMFAGHNTARTDPGRFGYASTPKQARLLWAEDVAEVARAWSDTMSRTRSFQHNPNFTTQTCCWSRIGENIVYTTLLSSYPSRDAAADRLMQVWMDSAGHRRNIMNGDFTQVGIGVTVDQTDRMWATAVFRRPTSAAPRGTTSYPGLTATTAPRVTPTARDITPACPARRIPASTYLDITNDRLRHAAACLQWWGVEAGRTPVTFGPNALVRRDEMATIVARAFVASGRRLPTPTRHHFADVPRTSVHARAINQLAEAGIIRGYKDGTFRPARNITRGQTASFLANAFEVRTQRALPAPTRRWFTDTADSPQRRRINQAADAGWAIGRKDGTYGPTQGVQRDRAAYLLTRWLAHLVADGHASRPR